MMDKALCQSRYWSCMELVIVLCEYMKEGDTTLDCLVMEVNSFIQGCVGVLNAQSLDHKTS